MTSPHRLFRAGGRVALLALLSVAALVPWSACPSEKRSGPVITGVWKTTPEDLPYTGSIPRVQTVSILVQFAGERDVISAR